MISKQKALDIVEGVNGNRVRIPFHIMFLTANRENWVIKKNAIKKLEGLRREMEDGRDGKVVGQVTQPRADFEREIAELEKKIRTIDVGGQLIEHDECVRSGLRGMHAKQKQTVSVNGVVDRRGSHFHTKNIVFLPGENVRKIHNDLIFEVNRQEVMY